MSYRIEDEPQPGAWTQLVVNPLWPLLAVMFGGAVVSWPWFAVNGFAVGSPSRRRELALVVGGFAGSLAILGGIVFLASAGILTGTGVRYALIALTVWKLAVSYWLYILQGRSFALYQHFGGQVRSGLIVVIAAALLRNRWLPAVSPLLARILS